MSSESAPTRSLNILLVEDDEAAQSAIAEYLIRHHHKVRRAWGVESALAALAEAPCEVLVADIGLPDGTGWHLLERAGKRLCPYAIAISGFDRPIDLADSSEAGFRRHLVKPFVTEHLIEALKEAADALPPPAGKLG
ncbi:MAG: response regulator [Chthoniobacteraceae bacterium]